MPIFSRITKFQTHVNRPDRIAELTSPRVRPGAGGARTRPDQHPARLLLWRDRRDAPQAGQDRALGRRPASLAEAAAERAQVRKIPGDRRRRRGDHVPWRRRGGGARRAARRAGGRELSAQRQLPEPPRALLRPARLPGLQGRDAHPRAGRRGARARHAARPVRHAAAIRHRVLAEGCPDHPGRSRPPHDRPDQADRRRRVGDAKAAAAELLARLQNQPLAGHANRARRGSPRSVARRPPGRRSFPGCPRPPARRSRRAGRCASSRRRCPRTPWSPPTSAMSARSQQLSALRCAEQLLRADELRQLRLCLPDRDRRQGRRAPTGRPSPMSATAPGA